MEWDDQNRGGWNRGYSARMVALDGRGDENKGKNSGLCEEKADEYGRGDYYGIGYKLQDCYNVVEYVKKERDG